MEQQEVIRLFKSKSLIEEIDRRQFKFPELQLVRIIYEYAPTYTQRLQMLRELAASSPSGQACELAEKCIRYQVNAMSSFKAPQTDSVFELHIQDDPYAYEERYLCRTYEGALQLFHTFHKHFECTAQEDGRYWIVSRKFVDDNTAESFPEDEGAICYLTKDCEIQGVNLWGVDEKDCDYECEHCSRICLKNITVAYPNFLKNYDAVRFYDLNEPRFGIAICSATSDTIDEAYILPLDSVYAQYRDYENIHQSHRHAVPSLTEKIDIGMLNDEFRKRYDSIVAYLQSC